MGLVAAAGAPEEAAMPHLRIGAFAVYAVQPGVRLSTDLELGCAGSHPATNYRGWLVSPHLALYGRARTTSAHWLEPLPATSSLGGGLGCTQP